MNTNTFRTQSVTTESVEVELLYCGRHVDWFTSLWAANQYVIRGVEAGNRRNDYTMYARRVVTVVTKSDLELVADYPTY